MTTLVGHIIEKYQGSVPQRVINAVEKAAQRTGADFSLLMEKAAAESSFNPAAKAKTSSATGLFQFIESTWLSMVKEHGHKYGLGAYADKIEMKNGHPCVDDCKAKDAILKLRNNPEISALMAGELTTGNKEYLEAHTDGAVGNTEMYLAHFLGAGSAAKFLNRRDDNGSRAAAELFPKEARANKTIFYDKQGHARSLDQVYSIFSRKIGDADVAANTTGTPASSPLARSVTTASAPHAPSLPLSSSMPLMHSLMAQTHPSSIVWQSADAAGRSGFAGSPAPNCHFPTPPVSPENMMLLTKVQEHMTDVFREKDDANKPRYNA